MAKFIDSIFTPGMSGKSGDKVLGKNKYGAFIRQAPVRTMPFTQNQLSQQSTFALLSPIWSSLEEADREEWDEKSKDKKIVRMLGNVNIKAGWNLFHSVNLTLLSAGEAIIEKVPVFKHPQSFKEIDIRIEKINRKKELILELMQAIREDTVLKIYGTKGMSPGIMRPNPNEYKIIGTVGCNTKLMPEGNKICLTECYEKRYGRLPINRQKVSFIIRPLHRFSAISGTPKTFKFIYKDAEESAIDEE